MWLSGRELFKDSINVIELRGSNRSLEAKI